MKFLRTTFIAIALIAPHTALAADWTRVASNINNAVYYIDSSSIIHTRSIAEFWVKIDHSKNKTVSYREEMQYWKFDCESKKSSLMETTSFNPNGTIIEKLERDYADWTRVVPESVGEAMLEYVCS